DVDVARPINRKCAWRVELPVARAVAPPLPYERASGGEHLYALVAGVCHVDVVRRVNRDARRAAQLPVTGAEAAPRRDERARGRELLYAVVAGVCDVYVARGVYGNPARAAYELAVTRALRAPTR